MSDLVPASSVVDRLRAILLGGIGSIPITGNLAAAVAGELWAAPLQRRTERCFAAIFERLRTIEAHTIDEGRVRDDVVLTCVALAGRQATWADDDKIEYLANAVANVVVDDAWEHDVAATLLRHVGELTAAHIRVLFMLDDPDAWTRQHGVTIDAVERDGAYRVRDMISGAFGQIGVDTGDLQVILQDLESSGLLNAIGIAEENPTDARRELLRMSSELGRTIVRFVTWSPSSSSAAT